MARKLNGSTAHMVGSFAAMNAAGSHSFWVKKSVADVEAGGTFHYLFDNSAGGRTLMYKNADGGYTWWQGGNSIFDDTVASKSLITGTDWQHVLLTWDNSLGANKEAAYRNGVLILNANVTVTLTGAVTTAYMGVRLDLTSFPWAGDFAEWCQWSVALNASEAAALAAGCPPTMIRPAALQRYWPLLGDSPEPNYAGGPAGTSAAQTSTTVSNHPGVASLTGVGDGYDPAPDFTGGAQSSNPGFIAAATNVYALSVSLVNSEAVPFIAAGTTVYQPSGFVELLACPFIAAGTALYTPGYTLTFSESAPFIAAGTTSYALTLANSGIGTVLGQSGAMSV